MAKRQSPPEVRAYYRELTCRAENLFGMLSSRRLEGWGHNPIDYRLEPISAAIWIRYEFFVSLENGDVFQDTVEGMKLRWTGVMLKRGTSVDVEPQLKLHGAVSTVVAKKTVVSSRRRKSPQQTRSFQKSRVDYVAAAIEDAGFYPDQQGLGPLVIAHKIWPIIEHLYGEASAEASRKAVERAFIKLRQRDQLINSRREKQRRSGSK
jgi:hypothetical protein